MARNKPPVNMSDRKEQVNLISSARHVFKRPLWNSDSGWQHGIADELVLWSEEETSTFIDEFFSKKCLSPSSYYRAAKVDGYLANALDITLARLGSRMSDKLKTTSEFLMKQHPKYDSLARLERQEKMEAEANSSTVTVYKEETIQIPVFKKEK